MSYRKLDVDSLNLEEDNDEVPVSPSVAVTLTEATEMAEARITEVSNLLMRGNLADALPKALENVPYNSSPEWNSLKEKNVKCLLDVLISAKPAEIATLVSSLDESQLGILMKYIFKVMETSTAPSNCSIILTWFDKMVELTGVGGIVRVLADPRTKTFMTRLDKPQIIPHIAHPLNYTPHDVKWIPGTAKLVVLGENSRGAGLLQVYALRQGKLEKLNETEAPSPFKCCSFGASARGPNCQLATGNFAGVLAVYDPEKSTTPIYETKAHSSIINCLDACGGNSVDYGPPEIVTGSRDGSIKVWDIRQKDTPVATFAPDPNGKVMDCWTVAFGNSYNDKDRYVCAGFENGDLKLFDLRTMKLQWETNLKNGICCVQFDRWDIQANKLVATTLESNFMVYDLRTFHPSQGYTGLKEKVPGNSTLWLAQHLPQNRDVFITSGGNGTLSLYKYHYPKKRCTDPTPTEPSKGIVGTVELINNAVFADQPISSFHWSSDKLGLCAMTAFDQQVRIGIVTRLNEC